jgi:hypothetical protein
MAEGASKQMHDTSRLGKYQYRYRGRRRKIFAFIFLHTLIAFLGYYIFFAPDSLLPSPPGGHWRLFFAGVGAAIIVCAAVMAIFRVSALLSVRIEIYERGFVICTGPAKKIVQYDDIDRIEYYSAAAYRHGVRFFAAKAVAFYGQNDAFLAQADSNTFKINEEAARAAQWAMACPDADTEEYADADYEEYVYNDEEDYDADACADEYVEAKPFWRYTKRAVNAIFDTANWA